MKTKTIIRSAFLAGLFALPAHAATLVEYNFSVLTGTRNDWTHLSSAYTGPSHWTGDPRTGNYLLSGTTETTALTGAIAGDLNAAGTGLAYSTASTTVGNLADGDINLANWVAANNVAGQSNVSGWISFTLSASAGYTLELESISFTGWRNGNGAPDTINFDYSLDGGSSWLDYGTAIIRSGTGSNVTTPEVFTQSLTIEEGESVLFRFAPYKSDTNASSGSNTGNWHITGLSLQGSVIPEPSAALLGALGFLALLRRQR